MSSQITISTGESAVSGRIVFLVGEGQPEGLGQLLGAYLGQADVERVVLVTADAAAASRAAAPYAAQREEGRLATVLAVAGMDAALAAAARGWGEPDLLISAGQPNLALAAPRAPRFVAPAALAFAG